LTPELELKKTGNLSVDNMLTYTINAGEIYGLNYSFYEFRENAQICS